MVGPTSPGAFLAPPPAAPAVTRPLNAAEHAQLVRRLRSPAAAGLRALGLLCAFGSLFLSYTYAEGFPYNPTTLLFELVGTMFVGLFASANAFRLVRDPRAAVRHGQVREATGPVAPGGLAPRGFVALSVGGFSLVLPSAVMAQVPTGAPVQVVVAEGLRAARVPGLGRVSRGLLLRLNGSDVKGLPAVYLT